MPSQETEVNRELQRRKALRKKREEQRRRQEQERKKLMLRLALVGVVLVLATGLILAVAGGMFTPGQTIPSQPPQTQPHQTQPPQTHQTTPQQTEPSGSEPGATNGPEELQEGTTVIHIAAAGDLNVTDRMIESASTPYGYNFASAFLDVAPVLSQADLTVLNYEGTFAGAPYGTQTGSAPPELAQALAAIGVDAVQTANSASIRAGLLGLKSTISTLEAAGIRPVGTFADASAFRSSGGYTIIEVKGLRIALVAFTKGMDNLGLPEGGKNCVNLLYEDYTTTYDKVDTDAIRKVLRNVAEEQPDLVIAMVHWGSEYNESISSTMKKIRNQLLDGGVDIILGTHPHLLKTVEHNTEKNTLVAYSLGDFYGDAPQRGSNYSIILDIEVTRDNATGQVTITGYDYVPIYSLQPEESAAGGQRVVRIEEAMARYNGNYLGKITASVYSSMEYALTRISERIAEPVK